MKYLKFLSPAILLFIAALFSPFTTQAQNIQFSDTHFKAVLLANAQVNTNGDNEIQKNEALSFSGALNISGSGIYDLSGIENFTNIISLDCSNNNLSLLDLSANRNLQRLDCNSNYMTELDVSNLSYLMLLDVHSNSIRRIDLSSNTFLIRLYIQNNQVENLDLSKTTELQILDCSNNDLKNLDISPNINLKSINCSSNNLSVLNLANNNNVNISSASIDARNNELICVKVDDQNFSSLNWSQQIDDTAFYSNNCTALPLKEVMQNDFTFYPNPATNVVTLYFGGVFERISLEIINTKGAVVMKKIYENSESANIELDFTPGVYMLVVNTGNGNYMTKKLFKK